MPLLGQDLLQEDQSRQLCGGRGREGEVAEREGQGTGTEALWTGYCVRQHAVPTSNMLSSEMAERKVNM